MKKVEAAAATIPAPPLRRGRRDSATGGYDSGELTPAIPLPPPARPPDPTRSEQRELGGNQDRRKQLPIAGVVHARRWTGKASILLLLLFIILIQALNFCSFWLTNF
jgi:hypothetical protein